MIAAKISNAARPVRKRSTPPAEAHKPTLRARNNVLSRATNLRAASAPVTPPVKSGSTSIGKKASNESREVRPLEANLPNRTSMRFTRVSSSRARVPSRRSLLIVSHVTRDAAHHIRKEVPTRPSNTPCPICPGVAEGTDKKSGGAQTNKPTAATMNRPQ